MAEVNASPDPLTIREFALLQAYRALKDATTAQLRLDASGQGDKGPCWTEVGRVNTLLVEAALAGVKEEIIAYLVDLPHIPPPALQREPVVHTGTVNAVIPIASIEDFILRHREDK